MDGMQHKGQNHSMGLWGVAGFFMALLAVASLFS